MKHGVVQSVHLMGVAAGFRAAKHARKPKVRQLHAPCTVMQGSSRILQLFSVEPLACSCLQETRSQATRQSRSACEDLLMNTHMTCELITHLAWR